MSGIRKLSNQDRTRLSQKASEETKNRSSGDEGLEVVGDTLHDGESNASKSTNGDGGLSAVSIADVGDEEQGDDFAGGIDCVESAEDGALGVVEVASPLGEGLETVHHGT